jgi:hypothetical protein
MNEYPCIDCGSNVRRRQEALQCDQCSQWQHRLCNTGKTFLSNFIAFVQYTQGHSVVDHLQRRTACHVWLGVYRCLLIAHLLCEYLIVAKLGVVNLYLKVIKLLLTCTCSYIYLITHYNFNSIILDK